MMMDYQEFKKALNTEFEEQIKQLGLERELGFDKVVKNNGVCMDGIVLKGESNIAPTVYANQLYQEYENGRNVEDIVFDTLRHLQRDMKIQDLDLERCTEWEFVKENVIFQVIGGEENQDRQGNSPFRKEEDLILTYRVLLEAGEKGMASYLLTNAMQENLGVTEEGLYQAAVSNMPRLLPPVLMNMENVIEEMLSDTVVEKTDSLDEMLAEIKKDDGMYVLSNTQKCFGAAYAFYPEVIDKIAKAFDKDIIVLPSSIHETILVPHMPGADLAEFKAMVTEINETQVSPEEVLANQVYVYDKVEKKLMIGDDWKMQKLKKELQPKQSIKDSLMEKKKQVAVRQPSEKKVANKDMEH